ncbi:hypothetical protein GCM10027414_29290 [Humibacter ginsengiterrae]
MFVASLTASDVTATAGVTPAATRIPATALMATKPAKAVMARVDLDPIQCKLRKNTGCPVHAFYMSFQAPAVDDRAGQSLICTRPAATARCKRVFAR